MYVLFVFHVNTLSCIAVILNHVSDLMNSLSLLSSSSFPSTLSPTLLSYSSLLLSSPTLLSYSPLLLSPPTLLLSSPTLLLSYSPLLLSSPTLLSYSPLLLSYSPLLLSSSPTLLSSPAPTLDLTFHSHPQPHFPLSISKSVRPEVRGTTDFYGGAYPLSKTFPSYALTTLIIFRCGRTGRDRWLQL